MNRYFGSRSFYKEAIAIALPVMMQQLIMSMVSLIDNFMVAGLGDLSMASVNVVNQFTFIFIVIINTICQAGGIYIAQFNGANDSTGMKHAYRFKVLLSILMAVLAFSIFRAFTEPLIALLTMGNIDQEGIIIIGSHYFNLISWTFLPVAISYSIGSSFREIAKPGVPLIISGIATLINTFGNWVLIYGNLGAPRLEVTGAAYATIIARFIEAVLFIFFAIILKAPFYVNFRNLLFANMRLFKEILNKSAMIFASEMSWASSETVMIAMYNRRGGAEVIAGMAAGWTICHIVFFIFGGIWVTTTVLVGGTLGAGKLDEARRRAQWLRSGSVVACIILALFGAVVAYFLIPIVFVNLSPVARATCLGLVLVILAYLPFWGYLNSQFAISRAGGDTAMGMYADLTVNTILFTPGAIILSYFTNFGPVLMFTILKLTDFIKIIICRHFIRKERWVKNLT
ncbi:MAG: MATE family efflux transporter [Treponema sp.]|nr:MATE family efflux transporter [Treponema sp.]